LQQETEYFIELFVFHRLETKINRKTGLFKHLGVFITLFFVVVISGFLFMDVKTSHAGTCGAPSAEGGMSTCTGGLNIVFNPAQPKIGEQVSVTVSLKDSGDANDFKSKGVTLFIDVILEEHWYGDDKVRVLNKGGNGASIQDSFLVAGIPNAGTYKTKVSMSYQTIAGPSVINYSFSQDIQLTVQAADNTGGPKLTVNSSESYADGPNITKGVSWVYLDGGSGKQAASYKVDCGDGKGDQTVGSGATSFRCVYPKTAKDYSAKVTAYDASGAQLVAGAITNSVTGTESAQGAGSDNTSSNPFGPLIIFINMVIGIILGFFQEIIYSIFYLLIAPIMQAMLSIHVYKDEFVSVIYPGWIVLRNLCNIIFIVAIMAIAMGTLLRVEAYKSRSVLVQLILAALMVNFSLVIGQVILGVADTVQSQFLPNNRDVIRALAKDLMVPYRATFQKLDIVQLGNFSETVKQFMFLILSIGSFMVFLAIAAFLFIRMVMLWILLLLSPLAYAAGALPQTSHYRKEWWTTFLKYAFFTPIMAFFLNLTAIIANTYKNNTIFTSIGLDSADFGGGATGSIASFVFQAGSTLVLIVFLIVALKVAESFSIFGAGEISKFAKKGMFAPAGIAKIGGSALGSKIGQTYSKWTSKKMTAAEEAGRGKSAAAWRAAQFLNFKVAKKAWEERAHEKEQEAYEPAYGQVRDSIGRIIPTEWTRNKDKNGKWYKPFKLGQKTFYGRIKQQQMISQKEREWDNADLSEEEKVEAWIAAHHPEDKEAIERLLIKGRHEDGRSIALGLIKRKKFEEETYKQLIANGDSEGVARAKAQSLAEEEIPAEYDSVDDLDHVTHGLEHAGLNGEQIGRIVAHLDELGEADRKLRAIGNAVYEFDGRFRTANDFSGYEKMEKALGSAEMLKDMAGLKNLWVEPEGGGVDYDEVVVTDASGAPIMEKDEHGNDVVKKTKVFKQLRFKDGVGNIHSIKNAADITSVSTATNKAEWKEEGGNLHYEMTGARKQQSAQKRVERGDSEAWGSALEPAAFMVQNDQGEFTRFTSYGRRLYQQYSSANTNSLKKGRKIQGRILKAVGLYKNDEGNFDMKKAKADVLAQGFELNEDLTEAILMKADLEETEAADLAEKVSVEMIKRIRSNKSDLPHTKLGYASKAQMQAATDDELKKKLLGDPAVPTSKGFLNIPKKGKATP